MKRDGISHLRPSTSLTSGPRCFSLVQFVASIPNRFSLFTFIFILDMQAQIWASTIPLYFIHPESTIPYVVHASRLSYLPLLLPQLTSFFGPVSSFAHEGILLKNLPIGLLYDLYQPELPWRLTLGDGPLFDIHDTFMNSVKEVRRPPKLRRARLICRPISFATARPRELCQCPKRTRRNSGMQYKTVSNSKEVVVCQLTRRR